MRSLKSPSLCLLQPHFMTFSKVGVNKTVSAVSPQTWLCGLVFSCLALVSTYPHLLKKNKTCGNKDSESDILRIVWSPILELLFPPNQHGIKVRTGETISHVSRGNKLGLYEDAPNTKAFKIDIRVIFKSESTHAKEVDIVCGEVARNDADSKVIADEGKLSREAKDAVDSMLPLIAGKSKSFSMQISGSTCWIATQQLARNGLYVYHPGFSFSLPSCVEELGEFEAIMQQLTSFQQHVVNIANSLEKALVKKCSLGRSFGNYNGAELNPILTWKRDTFYSPPRDKEAKVPSLLFGAPSSSSLISRLLKAKYSEGGENITYDQFGWGKTGNKWHNKITDETRVECPYNEE